MAEAALVFSLSVLSQVGRGSLRQTGPCPEPELPAMRESSRYYLTAALIRPSRSYGQTQGQPLGCRQHKIMIRFDRRPNISVLPDGAPASRHRRRRSERLPRESNRRCNFSADAPATLISILAADCEPGFLYLDPGSADPLSDRLPGSADLLSDDSQTQLIPTLADSPAQLIPSLTDSPAQLIPTLTDSPAQLIPTLTDSPTQLIPTLTDSPAQLIPTLTDSRLS